MKRALALSLIIAISTLSSGSITSLRDTYAQQNYCPTIPVSQSTPGNSHAFMAAFRGGTYTGPSTASYWNTTGTTTYGFYDLAHNHPLYADLEQFQQWDLVLERCPHILGFSDTINRGDIAVVLAKMGMHLKRIPNMVMPLEDPFTDVSVNSQYAIHLNTLKMFGVIDGNKSYAPYRLANRVEAVTMIARTYGLEGDPTVILPYKDIDNNAWYIPYLQAGYSAGFIPPMVDFRPNDLLTKEEFYTFLIYAHKKYLKTINERNTAYIANNTQRVRTGNPFETALTKRDTSTTTSNTGSYVNVDNTIRVHNRTSSSSIKIPVGAQGAPLVEFTVANGYNSNVLLKELSFEITGIMPNGALRDVALYDGFTQVATARVSKGQKTGTVTLTTPLRLTARKETTISLRGDFDDLIRVGDFQVSITDLSFTNTNNQDVYTRMSLPMTSGRIGFGTTRSLTSQVSAGNQNNFEIREYTNDAFIQNIRIANPSSSERLLLKGLTLRLRGGIGSSDVRNFRITDTFSGEQYGATVPRLVGDKAIFDFTSLPNGGILIDRDKDLLIAFSMDILNAGGKKVKVEIDETSDVYLVEQASNMQVTVIIDTYNAQAKTYTIEEGDDYFPEDGYYRFN